MDGILENRRRWFEEYARRLTQDSVTKPRQAGLLYPCPCCGYPTLEERGGYEICPLCNWEDDGQDDPHAEEIWGGPNGAYSLAEARENFRRYLVMYGPDKGDPRIGGGDSPAEKRAKEAMIAAFDRMVGETAPAVLETQWQQVMENRQILARELKARASGSN